MNISHRMTALAAISVALLGVAGLTTSAQGRGAPRPPNGSKAAFFAGGNGTAAWVSGTDSLVPTDTGGKVIQLSSPDGNSWGGFQGHGIDGVAVADVTALSYDFQVTTNWTGGGGGSPRLIVDFSDDGSVALNPVTSLTLGEWVHMDAISGAVDNSGGTCGYLYQATWSAAAACHAGASVVDAYIVIDSGWIAPMTVQVDNMTLNTTVYSGPGSAKK